MPLVTNRANATVTEDEHPDDHNALAVQHNAIEAATVYAAAPTGVGATDRAAINTAIAALPAAGGIVQLARGEYLLDQAVPLTKGVTLRGQGSNATVIKGPSSFDLLTITGTITAYASRKLLTANAVRSPVTGTGYVPKLTIAAADIATLGIVAGDYLLVGSDTTWPLSSQSTTQGEIVQVKHVDSANNQLVLRANLNDTYTTAGGSFVLKIVFAEDVVVEGIGFDNTTPQAGQSNFISISMGHRCVVRSCAMKNGDGRGIWRYNCLRCGVEDVHFQDFLGLGSNGSAYGVSDFNACQECWVTGCTGNRMWNVITTNGMAQPGVPRSNLYNDCTSWNHYNNAFSAHEEGEFNTYRNLKAFGGSQHEFDNATALTGVTAVNSTDTFTKTAHGLTNGNMVRITALTGGSNLVVGMAYFVVGVSGANFQVARSSGGAAVDLGSDVTAATVTLVDLALGSGMSVRAPNTIVENFVAVNCSRTGFWYRAGLAGLLADGIIIRQQHWTSLTGGHGLLIDGDSAIVRNVVVDGCDDQGVYVTGDDNYVEAHIKRSGLQGTDTPTTGGAVKFGSNNGGSRNTVVLRATDCPQAVDADSGVVTANRVIIEDLVNTPIGQTGWVQANDRSFTVKAASPRGTNVTTTAPGATLDGVTLAVNDRVLLKDQTTASQNGPWIWLGAAVAMVRPTDLLAKPFDTIQVQVEAGTENDKSSWELVTPNPITLDTTALRFTQRTPTLPHPQSSAPALGPFRHANSRIENMNRYQIVLANTAMLTTQVVRIFPLGLLRAGETFAALNFYVATTASAAITNSWGGIARLSDRIVLAISATSTATTAANTLKTFTFTSAFTPDKDETAIGFIMYQATTVPTVLGITTYATSNLQTAAPVINGTSNTGATTPVSVGATLTAFTADNEIPYAFLT